MSSYATSGPVMNEQARVAFLADKILNGALTFDQLRWELSNLPSLESEKNQFSGHRFEGGVEQDVNYLRAGRKAIEQRVQEIAKRRGVELGQIGDLVIPGRGNIGGKLGDATVHEGLVALHNAYRQATKLKPYRNGRHVSTAIDPGNVEQSTYNLRAWIR